MLIVPYQREERVAGASRLLIANEDQNDRALLIQLFEKEYALTVAKSGIEALEALHKQRFDLVLLDVTIPGMSGFDVLRAIRSEPAMADLPVILISGLNDNASVIQGLQLGANDYMNKPLDAEIVRARVSTQIALKRAIDTQKQTIMQLKFTHEMQENFTRIVSHDLKGPLTNIRLAQFMLRDILQDNQEAKTILDTMDLTLNGMIDMIRVFLDAMDSQQLAPRIEEVHVFDLVCEVVDQYRISAEPKGITLTMTDCDHSVKADPRLLHQVLSNLVSNAVKFSPTGSHTRIWTEQKETMLRICVADGGPGIPAEERGLLFSMFGKLSTRPTAGESSTGLGLWIVKELTELQGGRVGVDQAAEGGSLFWVELPLPDTVPPKDAPGA